MEKKNRIAEALSLRNIKAVELSEKSGISQSALSSYISQRWQPKQNALAKMAQVLEVSELWLAGYDIPKERPAEQVKADKLSQLVHRLRKNERLFNLSMSISELSDEELTAIENMVSLLRRE